MIFKIISNFLGVNLFFKLTLYCLTLNPVHVFILLTNAATPKLRNLSLVNKIRRHCIFSLTHTGYVRRFKREQMPSLISFRGVFNLKVWFL